MSNDTTAQEANPAAQAAPAPEQPKTAETPALAQEASGIESLPEWAKREILDLRKESAAQRKARQEAAEEAARLEETRLEAERKFAELAEKRQARIAELEPLAERYTALAARLTADLEQEIARLPEEIRNMRPAGADLDDLIDWTERAKTLATKMTAAQAAGAGPLPRPANGAARPASNQAATISAMRARF